MVLQQEEAGDERVEGHEQRAGGDAPPRRRRRGHHDLFQPLLYQVATAGLSSPDIAAPLRQILRRQRNTTVLLAEASGVDLARRRLILRDGEIAYDYLILAAGATHSYFGHDEWSR